MQTIIAIVGPTAVGKTEIALQLAESIHGEIVNMDSIQIYRRLDIGSAKPSLEERARVPHHLIDFVEPDLDFTVADYQEAAGEALREIHSRQSKAILTGGTGLYLNALMYRMDFNEADPEPEYRSELQRFADTAGAEALHARLAEVDPASAEEIHPNNVRRVIRALEINKISGTHKKSVQTHLEPNPDYDIILIGLNMNRHRLYARINHRVDLMIEQGLVDEVRSLKSSGLDDTSGAMKGIGYKEVLAYLNNQWDHETMVRMIKQNTRHYAKRQLTWFRRYPDITWFDVDDYSEKKKLVDEIKEIIVDRSRV